MRRTVACLAWTKWARRLESRSPSALLPTELLCAIFAHTTVAQRVPIASVCRRWSDILSRDPTLWTVLDFSGCTNFPGSVLDALLARSRAAQVEMRGLRYAAASRDAYVMATLALARHLARITVLELVFDWFSLGDEVEQLLACAAPALREASFINAPYLPQTLPRTLFKDFPSSPNLRKLGIHGLGLLKYSQMMVDRAPPLLGVEVLSLSKYWSFSCSVDLSHATPALRELHLDCLTARCPLVLAPDAARHGSLTLAEKQDKPCRLLEALLQALSAAHLRSVHVRKSSPDLLGILLYGIDGDCELSITSSAPDAVEFQVRLELPDGRTRSFDRVDAACSSPHRALALSSPPRASSRPTASMCLYTQVQTGTRLSLYWRRST